jgi:AMMECR1 domain-containing protein
MVYRGRRSTYLPQVWDDIPDPVMFLSRLCLKQNSPANCWMDRETILYRYGAYEFGEEKKDI